MVKLVTKVRPSQKASLKDTEVESKTKSNSRWHQQFAGLSLSQPRPPSQSPRSDLKWYLPSFPIFFSALVLCAIFNFVEHPTFGLSGDWVGCVSDFAWCQSVVSCCCEVCVFGFPLCCLQSGVIAFHRIHTPTLTFVHSHTVSHTLSWVDSISRRPVTFSYNSLLPCDRKNHIPPC